MKKNDVFTFTAPNGAEVTAIVVGIVSEHEENGFDESLLDNYLCYAQNRLFYYKHHYGHYKEFVGYYDDGPCMYDEGEVDKWFVGEVLIDYAILPECDAILEEAYLDKHENETL